MTPDRTEVAAAATLVLFRPAAAGGPPEILMLERAATMAFAAGAAVFPGGRVDPGDLDLAGGNGELAARIAAIRETIEEAGIAVGLAGAADIALLRRRLAEGRAFGRLLDDQALRLVPDALVPFARWQPDATVARRLFDTRFYIAEAPAGSTARPDGTECVDARWATAAAHLAGDRLIFPTRRNLERLAPCASFADAVADARAHPIRRITPFIQRREDGDWLTIPDDAGYPVTAERLDRARRG